MNAQEKGLALSGCHCERGCQGRRRREKAVEGRRFASARRERQSLSEIRLLYILPRRGGGTLVLSGSHRSCPVATLNTVHYPMCTWRARAEAEGLTLRVADNQAGYFGVTHRKRARTKPYDTSRGRRRGGRRRGGLQRRRR